MNKRKILGIDYGDFSIGLAIFDLETDFIFPYKTIFRDKANVLRKSVREIVEVVKIENITDIVIGLPINADGTEGERVEKVKNFARMLKNGLINANVVGENACGALCTGELSEPIRKGELYEPQIHFQDERLTTVEAKSILAERGIKKKEWKKTIDQIAAELILQDYKQAKNHTI